MNDADGAYNVAGEGGVKYSELVRICGRRKLPIPEWLMKKTAIGLKKTGLTAPIAGAVDLIAYPWVVSSEKLKKEFGFKFKFDSAGAFKEFARLIY